VIGDLPAGLELALPSARSFPASWRDAAIRELFDITRGGVVCGGCERAFRRPAELRRLQGDHILPFSRGGLTTWSNLQLLCGNCNLKKHAKVERVSNLFPRYG
jgi:5-methylcytosine-specific restriction endonuclease McrA